MKEYIITKEDHNRRLDKYLSGIMPKAGFGFLQKMMRKKNITLNGKKAHGADIIREGDKVCIFFSDETFDKMRDEASVENALEVISGIDTDGIEVVYEDEGMLVINKPFGVLSQKVRNDDVSVNELARAYLLNSGWLTAERFAGFRPSIVNRLDRNTGGLIIVAKTRAAAMSLSEDVKNKRIRRVYNALTHGRFDFSGIAQRYYEKNEKENLAILYDEDAPGRKLVKTRFEVLKSNASVSLIEAELLTGKSHQIRVMAAALNHPLFNDEKYGDKSLDAGHKFELVGQYLFAKRVIMRDGHIIETELPKEFVKAASGFGLEI